MYSCLESFVRILRMYLPLDCPVCGKSSFDGTPNMFCADCLRNLPFILGRTCPGCGGELYGIFAVCPSCMRERSRPWTKAWSLCRMEGLVRDVLLNCKYRNQPDLARALGDLAGDLLVREGVRADWIVPVPLHWTRYLKRGFNQSELLAARIARKTGIPLVCALRRTRRTRQQAKLGRAERICNLNDAFCMNRSTNVEKRAILLVDDVITTGSTLAAAADVLRTAGASDIQVMTIARR